MKEIWDNYVENVFGERKQAEFKYEQFEYNYRKFFPCSKEIKVLDIGVGRGEMLSCMKRWGYNKYLGIDISASTIEFCKGLGLNCILVNDTAAWLDKNKCKYDIVTLLDVLEHIHKDETIHILTTIKESLNDNGNLIIQVPNLQTPDGYLHRYNDFTHEVGFTENSLRHVLMTAGFTNIKFYGFETIISNTFNNKIKKVLRNIYWKWIKFARKVNCNLNPQILQPVLFAVVKK